MSIYFVLFSKVVRQWGICNIFFYIIYSIYDIILSASSTYLQAPVTLPAAPLTFLQDPSAVTLLQEAKKSHSTLKWSTEGRHDICMGY
jgi:hypothetical protein